LTSNQIIGRRSQQVTTGLDQDADTPPTS